MSTVTSGSRMDTEELREAARRLLLGRVKRRAPWDGEQDGRNALEHEVTEQGWYLLTIPEPWGGLGQGFDALAPIYEELGRAIAPLWLWMTVAGIDVLCADGSAEAEAIVRGIAADGHRIATALLPAGIPDKTFRLPVVAGADTATHILFVPIDGTESYLVACDAPGLTVRPIETWDLGRGYAEVQVENAASQMLVLSSPDTSAHVQAHSDLALAWDCVGAADQCLTETIDYMLNRNQFGRSIASFQALKHRAADHKVALELARSLVAHASQVYARRNEGWREVTAQARLLSTKAFRAIAEDAVQLHGGVGFTWEYDVHLFLKRSLANEVLDGTPVGLCDRIIGAVVQRALAALPRTLR